MLYFIYFLPFMVNKDYQKYSATVAVFGDSRSFRRQIVAEIGDYGLQCGQAISRYHFPKIIV